MEGPFVRFGDVISRINLPRSIFGRASFSSRDTDPAIDLEVGIVPADDPECMPEARQVEDPARKTWEKWQEALRRQRLREGIQWTSTISRM